MDQRDEIDELLTGAGERWRAGLPPLDGLNSAFRRRATRDRRSVSLLGTAGAMALVAVVVAVVLVAFLTRPTDHPIGAPSPTPAQPWRLIATLHTSSSEAYHVRVATNDDEWQALWSAVDPAAAIPQADLSTQIVASFGHGVGSSCPDLNLDAVVVDTGAKRIYSAASVPDSTLDCTADLVGAVVFVVAIDRGALPEGEFTISLESPQACSGATCAAVTVDLAASPPTPVAVTPSPGVTQPAVLYLENRGGPEFTVRIGGRDITTVACDSGAEISSGRDGVPDLPWDVEIVRSATGMTVDAARIAALPQWFVQIGDSSVGFSVFPISGPAGPTCPAEASPSPSPSPGGSSR